MKDFLAGLLSLLIPGLGQLYKGYFIQALIWFLVDGAVWSLLFWTGVIPPLLHVLCGLQAFFMKKA